MTDHVEAARARLDRVNPLRVRGRVTSLTGLVLRATLPDVRVGDHVQVSRGEGPPLDAEVVGFSSEQAVLMPLGDPIGVGPESLAERTGRRLSLRCGPGLLGRVIDGLGRPLDGAPLAGELEDWPVTRAAPAALERPRIERPLATGIRAIDGLLTLGEGQRVGLFAGPGVGKSTLLGQIARQADADVSVVCLVGERGRELREFIEDALADGLARSVVVCATSDAPPLVRLKSALVATAVAEYFREQGNRVLLLMDSVTRYARALREVGLAAGEPPVRRGFPPSVFAALPRLLERAGTSPRGSITGIYAVLVEGGDLEEPVADEMRGVLDGHIVLARDLAQRGHWPAIDVLGSLSRVMGSVTDAAQQDAAQRLRALLAVYQEKRDLVALGAYQHGSDPAFDRALGQIDAVHAFLRQPADRSEPLAQTRQALVALLAHG